MILLAICAFLVPIFLGFAISRFYFKDFDFYERTISSAALGIGIFALIFFILSEFFYVKFDFVNGLILMSTLFIIGIVIILFTKSAKIKYYNPLKDIFKTNTLIKILMLISILLILYKALFFPIISGDGLGFHAPIIKDIFLSGHLSHDVGTNTVEFTRAYPPIFFIYGAWMSILNGNYSELLIRFLPAFFGLLILVTVYALAKNIVFKDERRALLACFLLMTLPMFVNHNVYLNNDTIFAFFALAGIYFIMKYINYRETKNLILGFIILGFSINVKQLGIPLFASVLIPLFIILFHKDIYSMYIDMKNSKNVKFSKRFIRPITRFFQKKELRYLLIAILIVVILIAPYIIRNYIFFNDPIYPYLSASPTMSTIFHGKNFIPEIYAPLAETYDKWNIFYSPAYTLYSIVNFVKDKDYSVSLFLIFLMILAIASFKKMNANQKYLLYFSIIYFIYFAYTFLLKYRYAMAIFAMLCIIVADKFDSILMFRLKRQHKIWAASFLILLALLSAAYAIVLANLDKVITILGPLSSRFLEGLDVMIAMHLAVTMLVMLTILLIKNKKIRYYLVILLLIIPSIYSLTIINYGITKETTGAIDTSKDMTLFWEKELRFMPDRDAVLKMNFGDDYEAQIFLKYNTPKVAIILAYGGITYYSDREFILIDSYKVYGTYDATIDESMKILKDLNITYILYKYNSWEETVFNRGAVYEKSAITQNIDDTKYFRPIYNNSQYVVYEVIY